MLHWFSFPAEIRLIILELLAQENRGLSSYASVCKEWMEVIEKKNFCRLKLRPSCLDDLEHMVSRRRRLVRHIWLNIELRPYTCRSCQWTESSSWMSSNNTIISRAISKLFTILATWSVAGDGLTLELSAQSPSDTKHWFKNCYFGTDDEDGDVILESENRVQERIHDPRHGWVDGQQVTAPSQSSVQRLYEWVRLSFREELPTLHVVTKLVLCRQCRRRFNYRALTLLLDKLPRLECIVYEPWQAWDRMEQRWHDEEYRTMIEAHLPKRLKRLSIFEDYNDDFIALFQGASLLQADPIRITEPRVGAALAYRSLDLEQLSVSFMVDAQHFFRARQPL
ncbi:F-box domain-containing protein [Madurella fahalii]|uniref:F-box domain-containing protein n=1 Tax=Madurella fahalii TaxID=1157608 RepID=A0ABQ0G332_9PEZI